MDEVMLEEAGTARQIFGTFGTVTFGNVTINLFALAAGALAGLALLGLLAFLFLPLLNGGGTTGGTGYEVSYGAPSQSYGAPEYHEPSTGYDEPSSGYEEPSSGYDAPSTGYDSRRYDSRSLNTEWDLRPLQEALASPALLAGLQELLPSTFSPMVALLSGAAQ